MVMVIKRKLLKLGVARALTLPHSWIDFYGDRVNEVTITGSTLLIVAPQGLEAQARKIVDEMEANNMREVQEVKNE